jgi:MFS family permease
MRVIVSQRTLVVLLLAFAITGLGEGVFGVLYPIFVYRILHGTAPQIGDLMSAQAVGGLLGGLLVGWAGQRVLSRAVIGWCAMFFGLIDLAIFNTPAFLPALWHQVFGAPLGFPFFWVQIGLFVAVGIPGIGMLTGAQSLLQAATPPAYLGRVFGVLGVVLGLLGMLGTITAGTVTDHLGLITVLNIQGAGYLVAGLLLMTLLPRRQRTAPQAPPAETPVAPAAAVAAEL